MPIEFIGIVILRNTTMTIATQPLVSQETIDRLMAWLIQGDTGLSSKCLAATIMSNGKTANIKAYEASQHPLDGSDLNRCVKLLRQVPEMREHLSIMRPVSKYWEVLVDHWDELEELLDNELIANKKPGSSSLKGSTYKRMKELYAPIDAERYKHRI